MNKFKKIGLTFLILIVYSTINDFLGFSYNGLFEALLTILTFNSIFWLWTNLKTTLKWFLPGTLILLSMIDYVDNLTGLLVAGIILYYIFVPKKKRIKDLRLKPNHEKRYHDAGLNDQEIETFRSTMNEAKENIIALEKNIKASPKLQAIDIETKATVAAKALFKEIVEDPKKITQADVFLYKRLPNIVNLTEKYVKITQHKIKAETTVETLKKSEMVIRQVSEQIANDYTKFVADDLEELTIEAEVAKENTKNK